MVHETAKAADLQGDKMLVFDTWDPQWYFVGRILILIHVNSQSISRTEQIWGEPEWIHLILYK